MAFGKGKGKDPRRAAAGRGGSRFGKPRSAGIKGYVGAGVIGNPGKIVRGRQTRRGRDTFIQPLHLGFKMVGKAWVGKVRIKVVPGGSEKQRRAARKMRGFVLDVELSFGLRGGFIDKRTLLVNNKPSGLGEHRVKHLNAVLGRSILQGDILEIYIRPDIAKVIEKAVNEKKA